MQTNEASTVLNQLIGELRRIALPYVGTFDRLPGLAATKIKREVENMIEQRRATGNPFFIWSWNVELIGLRVKVRDGTVLFTETATMMIVRQRWEEPMDAVSTPLGSYNQYDLYFKRNVGLIARYGDGDQFLTYRTVGEDIEEQEVLPVMRVAYHRAHLLGYQEWFPEGFMLPKAVQPA